MSEHLRHACLPVSHTAPARAPLLSHVTSPAGGSELAAVRSDPDAVSTAAPHATSRADGVQAWLQHLHTAPERRPRRNFLGRMAARSLHGSEKRHGARASVRTCALGSGSAVARRWVVRSAQRARQQPGGYAQPAAQRQQRGRPAPSPGAARKLVRPAGCGASRVHASASAHGQSKRQRVHCQLLRELATASGRVASHQTVMLLQPGDSVCWRLASSAPAPPGAKSSALAQAGAAAKHGDAPACVAPCATAPVAPAAPRAEAQRALAVVVRCRQCKAPRGPRTPLM